MTAPSQIKIPACYMRGGTSKGVLFCLNELPESARTPGESRDNLLLRVIGSPDPYSKQMDGMGGGSSSTSKVAIIAKSKQPDHDIDYWFGQVAIDQALIDWSGNCGNLTAAVAPFAIAKQLVETPHIPHNGLASIKIWQANINKTIVAHVPIVNGHVQELGDFVLDGVTFPAAEIQLEFLDPTPELENNDNSAVFPTGNLIDILDVPNVGPIKATLINAGIPTIIVQADCLGYNGTELQDEINQDAKALAKFETIRAYGALKMGLIQTMDEAKHRQHTPKVIFIAPPKTYTNVTGTTTTADSIHLLTRAISMGKLHHAMMGTVAIAIASAAAIEYTLASEVMGDVVREKLSLGHPSGTLKVSAHVYKKNGSWHVSKAILSRSARILMEGWVHVPVSVLHPRPETR